MLKKDDPDIQYIWDEIGCGYWDELLRDDAAYKPTDYTNKYIRKRITKAKKLKKQLDEMEADLYEYCEKNNYGYAD